MRHHALQQSVQINFLQKWISPSKYCHLTIDLSQDTVDLVSAGRKSLILIKASLSILISRSREIETIMTQ